MNNQFIEIINRSKYFVYLSTIGINTDAIKNEIVESIDENEIDNFSNRSHRLLSPNVYLESLVFKQVCKYLYEEYKDSVIFENESKLRIPAKVNTDSGFSVNT